VECRGVVMSEQWDYKKAGLDLGKYEETIAITEETWNACFSRPHQAVV